MPALLFSLAIPAIAPFRSVQAQRSHDAGLSALSDPSFDLGTILGAAESPSRPSIEVESNRSGLPPDPAGGDDTRERANAPWAAQVRQVPFSRVSIGADVNPMGIGLKSAILLSRYLDGRAIGNVFGYDTGRFELEGFNVDGNIHLASAGADLDWYPFNSVWRFSVGALFYNSNEVSMTSRIVPGTSFTLNGTTFYAATPNAATGVTPLTAIGVLGLHTHEPALMLSFGFGRFIPRSNRHWSFPAEFGVAFTGAPTIDVNPSGWVCTDKAQSQCGSLSNSGNPVTVAFNNALQATLTKWRKTASNYPVYPLFSYSVVYSFNIR